MATRNAHGPSLVLAAALSLAACGGSDGTNSATSGEPTAAPDSAQETPVVEPTGDDSGATSVTTSGEAAATTVVLETTPPPSTEPVIESTKSLAVTVDVGGIAPTDPVEIELQQELDGFLAANGIPTDQPQMLAYFGADRFVHLFIENATIRMVSTEWWVDEDGAGKVAANATYRLDRTGIDEAMVADAIESAMAAQDLDLTVRQDIEEGVSSDLKLQFGPNGEDNFKVRILGPDDDAPDSTTLVITATASFEDVVPQLLEPVAPLGPTIDRITPDGPIIRIETRAENNPFPLVDRRLVRLTSVAPADFDDYVVEVDAAAAEIYGDDRIIEEIEDDMARFQTRGDRVEASIEEEGVVLLLADSILPD